MVNSKDVQKPAEPDAEQVPAPEKPFISEGTRLDILQYGQATDPFTGRMLTRDDL